MKEFEEEFEAISRMPELDSTWILGFGPEALTFEYRFAQY